MICGVFAGSDACAVIGGSYDISAGNGEIADASLAAANARAMMTYCGNVAAVDGQISNPGRIAVTAADTSGAFRSFGCDRSAVDYHYAWHFIIVTADTCARFVIFSDNFIVKFIVKFVVIAVLAAVSKERAGAFRTNRQRGA